MAEETFRGALRFAEFLGTFISRLGKHVPEKVTELWLVEKQTCEIISASGEILKFSVKDIMSEIFVGGYCLV